ncbi:recQ-mediated genome instability protein 1-like [Homalodisca vitripennis]|uniref:recQ-mediated genome instability protein 1-like n=1 Tax=Homalodisca vitripennis TaxID=197043 RepID=UPI001EEA4C65|nr:recQ-mediated genome instability protein 1-like [Homalodisca vitripennis]
MGFNMNISEAESVCRYLRSREIQMLPNNEWLLNCMDWYRSHPELVQVYGSLQEYVCIQWLLADLQDVQHGCLPTNYNNGNLELSGKYTVQINWIRDIGQSCYSQLRAAQNINEAESNDSVSADEPKKQSWEPNPKRVLMMEISDGLTTLKAMEYAPIPKLTEPFLPGLKVLLLGPIECRRGILFLKNNNINLLGGEADHLFQINSKENLLSRCLNIPGSTATEERHISRDINQSSVRTNRRQQHINRDTGRFSTNGK